LVPGCDGNAATITSLAIVTQRSASAPGLPSPRGPLTEDLLRHLRFAPHEIGQVARAVDDPIEGEDSALALYLLYELHYRSFAGVHDGWEWEPSLLRVRRRLEDAFESRLLERVPAVPTSPREVVPELLATASAPGPSLSAYMQRDGTLGQMREFAIHRSAYQRKEADPHTWAIPRLAGRAKAALVDIQIGEYGDGSVDGCHAELFARTMRALELDPEYGQYLDVIPGATLATVNLVSMFGLHRRWRGALIGHLALFEMTSVVPMGRYAATLRRLGVSDAAPFSDAHVEADARHEIVALHEMAGALALDEPDLAASIVFGARAVAELERSFAQHLLDAWSQHRSSLRSRCG
jgi:hypothetical protein